MTVNSSIHLAFDMLAKCCPMILNVMHQIKAAQRREPTQVRQHRAHHPHAIHQTTLGSLAGLHAEFHLKEKGKNYGDSRLLQRS